MNLVPTSQKTSLKDVASGKASKNKRVQIVLSTLSNKPPSVSHEEEEGHYICTHFECDSVQCGVQQIKR